jgi:hypothetical protein
MKTIIEKIEDDGTTAIGYQDNIPAQWSMFDDKDVIQYDNTSDVEWVGCYSTWVLVDGEWVEETEETEEEQKKMTGHDDKEIDYYYDGSYMIIED